MKKTIVVGSLFLALACGCSKEKAHDSKLTYLISDFEDSLFQYINLPSLPVCFKKESLKNQKYRQWIKKAVLSWVEPLRSISPYPLTTEVVTVEETSQNPCPDTNQMGEWNIPKEKWKTFLTVNISPDAGNAGGGLTADVIVTPNPIAADELLEYSTTLHEVGHDFQLGDLYLDSCENAGHQIDDADDPWANTCPEDSVMNAFHIHPPQNLTEDDIAGVRYLFKKFLSRQ